MTYRTSIADTPLSVRERSLVAELADVRRKLEAMPPDDPLGKLLAAEEIRIELELDHVRRALGVIAPFALSREPPQKKGSWPVMLFTLLYVAAVTYLLAPWR